MLRAMLAATLVALVALIVSVRADASPYVSYGIQDDAWLLGGPGTFDERVAKLDRLGVEVVRVNVRWNQIAPRRPVRPSVATDPAYRWDASDLLLRGLHAQGIRPVVTLVGTPAWANGGRGPAYAPRSGADFASFAYAVSKRYPFVRHWVIWNEPNQDWQLRPTSPVTYVRTLLNPAYSALKRSSRANQVAGGATAPRGDVLPPTWIRGMRGAGARLDAYAHHPYPLRRTERPLASLPAVLREVTRAFGRKRVWLTEFGYQTNPPDRFFGVSPSQQAAYVAEAARIAYATPRVDMLIQFLVRDEAHVGRWQSGLYDIRNVAKPSATAFALPLTQSARSGNTVTLWGQVRPGSGVQTYRIRGRIGGGWRWVTASRTTNARGVFSVRVHAPPGSYVQLFARGEYGVSLRTR